MLQVRWIELSHMPKEIVSIVKDEVLHKVCNKWHTSLGALWTIEGSLIA